MDADGVFFDFDASWEAVVARVTGAPISITPNVWPLDEKYSITPEELAECWRQFNEGGEWSLMPSIAGAPEWLNAVLDRGIRVSIVTSIDPLFAEQRRQAFRSAGVDPDRIELHCAGLGSSKLDIFRRLKPRLHIDDHGKHLTEAESAGVPVRVLLQGFMQDHPHATHRVASLANLCLDMLDIHTRQAMFRPGRQA